jgi:hypothetical protein
MAVLVQEQLASEYSFVLHTESPVERDPNLLYAELAAGLGETLASGTRGSPWRLAVNKQTGARRLVGDSYLVCPIAVSPYVLSLSLMIASSRQRHRKSLLHLLAKQVSAWASHCCQNANGGLNFRNICSTAGEFITHRIQGRCCWLCRDAGSTHNNPNEGDQTVRGPAHNI